MEEFCVFVIPELWVFPESVDPENITSEEQGLIDKWQEAKDAIDNLILAISPSHGWMLEGNHFDIVDPKKTVRLSKAGEFYGAVWFRLDRLLVDNPSGWFVSEMAKLTGPGLKFQGFIAEDVHAELLERGYELVGGGE